MNIIESNDLTYTYHDGTTAIKGVNLTINKGENIALLGSNGAGKSTFLKIISGLMFPYSGKIKLFDNEMTKKNSDQLRVNIGMVFQDPDDQIFMPRVWDDVAFGPINLGLSEEEVKIRVKMAMEQTNLIGYEERIPHHLSYGEKKRVAIAGVIAMNPLLLLLDEFTANLDPCGRNEIIDLLKNIDSTKIIASHDIEMLIEVCDRAILLDNGEIVGDGKVEEILTNIALLHEHGLDVPTVVRLFGKDSIEIIRNKDFNIENYVKKS